MTSQAITLHLPDRLYQRLAQAADVSRQTLDDVMLHSIRAGLPPSLDRVLQCFQADLRALDQLSDEERARLNTLREESDLLMLRRSCAYALLKWRGHRIPTLSELQRP